MSFAYLKPFNKKRLLLKILNDYCLIDTETDFFRPNWGLQFTSHFVHLILHSPYLRVRVYLLYAWHACRHEIKRMFVCDRSMSRKCHMSNINDNILTNLLLTAFLHFCYTRGTVSLANFNIIYGIVCMYWQSIQHLRLIRRQRKKSISVGIFNNDENGHLLSKFFKTIADLDIFKVYYVNLKTIEQIDNAYDYWTYTYVYCMEFWRNKIDFGQYLYAQ